MWSFGRICRGNQGVYYPEPVHNANYRSSASQQDASKVAHCPCSLYLTQTAAV